MVIKLTSRYRNVIFAFMMSFSTALIVSGVITFLNTATISLFLEKWPTSFLLGWPIVFLSILFIAPQVNRLVNFIVK